MILGVIPARYHSTRFPGKPLIDIRGKTMIQRVYEQSSQSSRINKLVVATDDKRIFDHVNNFGGAVVMTNSNHSSGTDRCAEVVSLLGEQIDYVINIQGDEPLIDPRQVDELAEILDGQVDLATQVSKITQNEMLTNPSVVKVVLNERSEAMYFSRSPIPYFRNKPESEWQQLHEYYRHTGLYAYRSDVLEKITNMPPSPLEMAESLEQLRWLENGFKIKCMITGYESLAVDNPEDVEAVISRLNKG